MIFPGKVCGVPSTNTMRGDYQRGKLFKNWPFYHSASFVAEQWHVTGIQNQHLVGPTDWQDNIRLLRATQAEKQLLVVFPCPCLEERRRCGRHFYWTKLKPQIVVRSSSTGHLAEPGGINRRSSPDLLSSKFELLWLPENCHFGALSKWVIA